MSEANKPKPSDRFKQLLEVHLNTEPDEPLEISRWRALLALLDERPAPIAIAVPERHIALLHDVIRELINAGTTEMTGLERYALRLIAGYPSPSREPLESE